MIASSPKFRKKASLTQLPISMVVGLVVVAIMVVGAVAAIYLSNQSTELRQQAAGERAVVCAPGTWSSCGSNATPTCPTGQARRCNTNNTWGNCQTPPAGTCGGSVQRCGVCNNSGDCAAGLTCRVVAAGYRCVTSTDTNSACPNDGGTGQPIPDSYGSCSNGCCTVTPAGSAAGCYVVGYQCPGGELPCGQNGSTSNGTMCNAAGYCGSQQVDLRCPGYSTAGSFQTSSKPMNCGSTPTNPPTTPSTPPGTGGAPTPVPTQPPTPISCAGLEILDPVTLQKLPTKPTTGQSVRFRCIGAAGSQPDYYFFAYTDVLGQAMKLIYQGPSDLTFPITVQPYMVVQCNPCRGSECSSGESVNQNCTFINQAPPSPTPSPSPTPVAVACYSLTQSTVATNQNGTVTYRFTCGGAPGSNYYFFAYQSSPTGPMQPFAQGPANTADLTVATNSYLVVQCNPCVGSTCSSSASVNNNCTYRQAAIASPTPVASAVLPSPTPAITPGPQCLGITLSNTNAQVGDVVTATCTQVPGAARYISRVMLPSGQIRDLNMTGRVSEQVQITSAGTYVFQCQICTDNTTASCFAYEPTSVIYEDPIAPPGTN